MISEGQIVLFRFPQTDQQAGKLRPALVVYIIQSIRTLNPILSERPFYDSFPAVSTLQKCSI
jgi:hypothetical protein